MSTDTPEPLSDAELEALAAEIHIVYCEEYERRFGEPYWTGGDYSKLDEPTKNYDRNLVRWHLAKTAAAREELEQAHDRAKIAESANGHLMNSLDGFLERAQAAEANCAALREALTKSFPEIGYEKQDEFGGCLYCGVGEPYQIDVPLDGHDPACWWRQQRELLAQPNPGAGLLERLRLLEEKNMRLQRIVDDLAAAVGGLPASMALAQAGEEQS